MMIGSYFIEVEYLILAGALLSQIGLAAWHAGDWWGDWLKALKEENKDEHE